jgi:hypothetical protein
VSSGTCSAVRADNAPLASKGNIRGLPHQPDCASALSPCCLNAFLLLALFMRQPESPPAPVLKGSPKRKVVGPADNVRKFIDGECQHSETASEESSTLWQAYLAWCKAHRQQPATRKVLGCKLRDRGFQNHRGHTVKWIGVRLRPRRRKRAP